MDIVQFIQRMLRETSETRLMKHCRGMNVALTVYRPEAFRYQAALGERTSRIVLQGPLGQITIKTHFDLDTAVSWAAQSTGKSKDDVDDPDAVDFMREYSNLHAGHLRGLLEGVGAKFGMSLPFVTLGETELPANIPGASPAQAGDAWILTDGALDVICTSEVELLNLKTFASLQPALAAALEADTAKSVTGENDGEVEFFL